MVLTILIAVALLAATVLWHYECLRFMSAAIPKLEIRAQSRIVVVLLAVFFVHIVEILLYAAAYQIMADHLSLGGIGGEFTGHPIDYFYFSATTYTTLGVGDVFPHGPVRLVAGLEALNGLLLIGWSASFTYISMEKFWGQHRRRA